MNENELSHKIIGAALEVHKALRPGLLESAPLPKNIDYILCGLCAFAVKNILSPLAPCFSRSARQAKPQEFSSLRLCGETRIDSYSLRSLRLCGEKGLN